METDTNECLTCGRIVPSANYVMHEARCRRDQTRCEKCGEVVLKIRMPEHMEEYHTTVQCECGENVIRARMQTHKLECAKKLIECNFCQMEFEISEIADHIDFCSSRTNECPNCMKRFLLKELNAHMSSCRIKSPEPTDSPSSTSEHSPEYDVSLVGPAEEGSNEDARRYLIQQLLRNVRSNKDDRDEIVMQIVESEGLDEEEKKKVIAQFFSSTSDALASSLPAQSNPPNPNPSFDTILQDQRDFVPERVDRALPSATKTLEPASESELAQPESSDFSSRFSALPQPIALPVHQKMKIASHDAVPHPEGLIGLQEQLHQYPLPTPFSSYNTWAELTQPFPLGSGATESRFMNMITMKSFIHSKRHAIFLRQFEESHVPEIPKLPELGHLVHEIETDFGVRLIDMDIEPLYPDSQPTPESLFMSIATGLQMTSRSQHYQESVLKCDICGVKVVSSFIENHKRNCVESKANSRGDAIQRLREKIKSHES